MSAGAALTTGNVLAFDTGSKNQFCPYGGTPPTCMYGSTSTTVSGSWFSMDTNADGSVAINEITVISMNDGLEIGVTQSASGSHSGAPNGSESPGIDNPWSFFGNTGMHKTTSAVTESGTHTGATATLDFSGWAVVWNTISTIPMGGDSANFGGDSGLATITCSSSSCSISSTYTLDYAAHVPLGDASGFGGVQYALHLEGHVEEAAAAVPVPAAVWLFGSGLLGLVGVARRKKSA